MEIRPIYRRALELFRRRKVHVTPPPPSPEAIKTLPALKRSKKSSGRGSSHGRWVKGRSPIYGFRIDGLLPWT